MKTKPLIVALLAAALVAPFTSVPAAAQDSAAQSATASEASLAGTGLIVDGSVGVLVAGGDLIVATVTPLVDASIIVLRNVATGAKVSIRVASGVAQQTSVAVGETVSVVVEATGYSLVAGGRIVAFIPNNAGRAMLYQARSTQR